MKAFKKFSACLLVLGFAFNIVVRAQDQGVIHFHEIKKPARPYMLDAKNPNFVAQESICWWGDLEPQEGKYDWRSLDAELTRMQEAGKKLDIRVATAHNSPFHSPEWLFENYKVRRVGKGLWCDFESGVDNYQLGTHAQLSTNRPEVISGSKSLVAGNASTNCSRELLLLTGKHALAPRASYSFQMDARTGSGISGDVLVVSPSLANTNRFRFTLPSGYDGSLSFRLDTSDSSDTELRVTVDPVGDLAVDNVNLIRMAARSEIQVEEFQQTEGKGEVIEGKWWMLSTEPGLAFRRAGVDGIVVRNGTKESKRFAWNNAETFPIRQGEGYLASFDFKALSEVKLRLRLVSQSSPYEVLDENTLDLRPGDSARHHWSYPTFVWLPNCRLELWLDTPGAVELRNLTWSCWSERVTCFPDYFSPVFKEKWESFMKAFASRYGNHPGIGCISVGGFGRWEEVILDNDVYGSLDSQWLARGFNQNRYLEHVTWCMDLYKRLFADKSLRICLAYGLYHKNDRDFIYRRTAQEAVSRGIGLKQNGMSERYDTWDANTSASYLFNRYRFAPGVSLTYETAGQLTRLSHHSYGHPLSVLNRVIIDGADYLFMYPSDIAGRHVNKYLPWMNQALARPLLTTFYCRLGDYSLVTEASPSPQPYRNQWLGVREFRMEGADPMHETRTGRRCATTRSGAPNIVFDVDDRQQYHGLSGVTFGISYLDTGNDQFEVNCFDQSSGRWRRLGLVRKTGTDSWKSVEMADSRWCRSSRNGGEDTHADVVIGDLGDGNESISDVWMRHVPAREWRRRTLYEAVPSTKYRALNSTLAHEFTLPAGKTARWVAVPIWVGSKEENSKCRMEVYGIPEGDGALPIRIANKEYFLPADGDWLEVPIDEVVDVERYRIELSEPQGLLGWYSGASGTPAFRCQDYAEPKGQQPWLKACDSSVSGVDSYEFMSSSPVSGLRVSGKYAKNRQLQISRALVDGQWTTIKVFPELRAELYFEPQPPGKFRVEVAPGGRARDTAVRIKPMLLDRLERPSTPRSGASMGRQSVDLHPESRFLTAEKPVKITLLKVWQCGTNDVLIVKMANSTGAALLDVSWQTGAEPDATKSALIPLIQNDVFSREYRFRIGSEPAWQENVQKLSFLLAPAGVQGACKLEEVRLVGY